MLQKEVTLEMVLDWSFEIPGFKANGSERELRQTTEKVSTIERVTKRILIYAMRSKKRRGNFETKRKFGEKGENNQQHSA